MILASEQLVVFQLGSEEYALSITQVKEIIRYDGATKLPDTPDYLEGIINLRGKVIPVVDLANRFSLVRERTSNVKAVIVETTGREVGLVVDEVTEVLRIDDADIETTQTICHAGDLFRGIGKLQERLLIVLDLDKLLSEEELEKMKSPQ